MSARFAIYETADGTRIVSDEHDMDIVDALSEGGHTVGALSKRTGMSRSTVSARLIRLRKKGIVDTVPTDDSRERMYTIAADRLMHSERPPSDSKAVFLSSVEMILDGKAGLYDGLTESIFYGAVVGGLNTGPIFVSIGEHIGRKVADSCEKEDFFGLFERLNNLFKSNGIGSFTMTMTYYVRIVFTVGERYRNGESKVMEAIYRNIIKSAMERNSGKSMVMKYEPISDPERFEFELWFDDSYTRDSV